jgi:DNA-binding response OmpR family regulator
MARALVLTDDLLFGSGVKASLEMAGHEALLVRDEQRLRDALAQRVPEVLVLDLTDADLDAVAVHGALVPELAGVRTLAYYAHIDPDARELALAAGIEVVVPRSRFAREGAALVDALLAHAR